MRVTGQAPEIFEPNSEEYAALTREYKLAPELQPPAVLWARYEEYPARIMFFGPSALSKAREYVHWHKNTTPVIVSWKQGDVQHSYNLKNVNQVVWNRDGLVVFTHGTTTVTVPRNETEQFLEVWRRYVGETESTGADTAIQG